MPSRFDQLESLRKAAWESFSTRRAFEWRISVAFWGLLAAFIVAVAKIDERVAISLCEKFLLLFVPVLLGFAHVNWLWGLKRASDLDKKEEGCFREAMRLDISYSEPGGVTDLRTELIKKRSFWNWNFSSQFITTAALTLLAMLSICFLLQVK